MPSCHVALTSKWQIFYHHYTQDINVSWQQNNVTCRLHVTFFCWYSAIFDTPYLQMATHLSSLHLWQSTLQHQWKVQLQGFILDFLMSAWPRPQQSRSQDPERDVRPMRHTRPEVPAESVLVSASQKLGDLVIWRLLSQIYNLSVEILTTMSCYVRIMVLVILRIYYI